MSATLIVTMILTKVWMVETAGLSRAPSAASSDQMQPLLDLGLVNNNSNHDRQMLLPRQERQ